MTTSEAMSDIEIDAEVYRVIRANQHRPKRVIYRLIQDHLSISPESIAASLGRLAERMSN